MAWLRPEDEARLRLAGWLIVSDDVSGFAGIKNTSRFPFEDYFDACRWGDAGGWRLALAGGYVSDHGDVESVVSRILEVSNILEEVTT